MSTDVEKPLPPLCQDTSHLPFADVPKRKPVPIAKASPAPAAIATKESNVHPPTKAAWWDWRQFSKKKRLIVAAVAVAVVCLLALIIGLAVGLTRGKR